jgi:hypothetical protein
MLVARLREPGGRPAGFPLWPFRNWGILLTPLLVLGFGVRGGGGQKTLAFGAPGVGAQKTQGVFGVPRVRAMKNPARFPGPGLGTLLKDIFLYMGPVSTSRSHKLQNPQVAQGSTSAPRTGCIRHPKKYLLGTPACWRPSNEKLGTVSRSGLDTLSSVLESRYNPYSPEVVNFLVFSTKGASPLSDLRLLRKQGAEPAFKIGPRTCCLRRCRVASDLEGATLLFAEPDSSHRAGGF